MTINNKRCLSAQKSGEGSFFVVSIMEDIVVKNLWKI